MYLTLRMLLADRPGGPLNMDSVGTHALSGAPVASLMRSVLAADGVDASGFLARQIDDRDIDGAGLIVTASRVHRTYIAQRRPRAHSRVFTLLQIQRLLRHAKAPDLTSREDPVADLALHFLRVRGTAGPSAGEDDDVPDPWGRSAQEYRAAATLMAPAVAELARTLRPR